MDSMFLGSEVVIMSVDDARKLVVNLLGCSDRAMIEELQQLGVLDILMDLRSAVRRQELQQLGVLDILMDLHYAVKRHISSVPEVEED